MKGECIWKRADGGGVLQVGFGDLTFQSLSEDSGPIKGILKDLGGGFLEFGDSKWKISWDGGR